jgi:clan AA aspartic protease (TIGR02281 family)
MIRFYIILSLLILSINAHSQNNLEKGFEFMEKEEYENAIDAFSKEIEEKPSSPGGYYWRSVVYYYYQEDRYREALSDITKGIGLVAKKDKKTKAIYLRHRGDVYSYMKNGENAIKDYNEAIVLDPENKNGFLKRGEFYLNEKKPETALSDFEKAKKIDDSDEDAEMGVGRAYSDMKQLEKSNTIFDEIIRLNADNEKAFYYRSLNYLSLNKFEEAIKDMFLCVQKNSDYYSSFLMVAENNIPYSIAIVSEKILEQPSLQSLYFTRSYLYETDNQYPEAIGDYNKLIELGEEEDLTNLFFRKGRCFYFMGHYAGAVYFFDAALQKDSSHAYLYGWRGLCRFLQSDYKGAENDLSTAIKREPGRAWYYSYRADVRFPFLNDKKGAQNDYNMAFSLDKTSYSDVLKRGRLYNKAFNLQDKAYEDFKKIIAADSSSVDQYTKAQALFFVGKPEEAKEILNAFSKKTENETALYEFARLAVLLNETESAISLLEKAFDKGFCRFEKIDIDPDFDALKKNEKFKSLLNELTEKRNLSFSQLNESFENNNDNASVKSATIPMKSKGSGTYEVPCKINNLPLNMIFDTGASDISISKTEVQFMLKNGYLNKNDFLGSQRYIDANGDISVGATIIFRSVEFGGVVLKNVKATVVNNNNAPLLFGQSALSKYGKIIIDNEKKQITISLK